MKQTLITLIFALILGFAIPKQVFAIENESGATASLSFQQVINRNNRADKLETFLRAFDSPLASEAEHFVSEADRVGIDWKFVAAISGVESTFGKHIPSGSYNAWGWGIPTGAQSGLAFSSWKEAITTVSEGLRFNYLDRGAQTVEQIGRIYAASPRWAGNVRFFLEKIEMFTPNDPSLLAVTL